MSRAQCPVGPAPFTQLELFERHLPDKPWCTDGDHGSYLRVLPRTAAKRRRYIQPQPPWLRVWMVFDVDRNASWEAADEAGLPAPTWTAINRQNGHGHLGYGIDTPVRLEDWNGRRGPANYAADVERAMTARLGADPSYSGFTCKNPLHRHWITLWSDHPYSLGELHGWLGDLNQYPLPQRTVGVGRNVETFDAVRGWAYRRVLQHKADGGSLETWRMACVGAAEQFTGEHHDPPLHRSECAWIGRSIGKWTGAKLTPERFAEIQSERGKASGARRREAVAERNRRILALSESGATWGAIAEALGVSRSTVARVVRGWGCHEPYQDTSPAGRLG